MAKMKEGRWDSALWGFLLIGFGVLLLSGTLGLDIGRAWSWWPFALLALGAVRFATARRYGKRRGGLVMMLLGAWGWVSISGLWGLGWRNSWPLLIIGFGALTVFESLFGWGSREDDHA
jgi:hypothetical protein